VSTADRTYRALLDALALMQSQLDELAYLLEVHALVIGSGSIDAVQRTTRDIEHAIRQVADTERVCGDCTDLLTGRPGTALADLIESSPEPWRGLLAHHRASLGTTQLVVAEFATAAERAARRAARRQRDTYAAAVGQSNTDYPSELATPSGRALLLDRSG
jgi:hypothetical protein